MRICPPLLTAFSVLSLASAFLFPPSGRTQSVPNQLNAGTTTGTMPYTTYGGVHENINLSTGDLNLQIPLLTLLGRNGHSLTVNMYYDSKLAILQENLDPNTLNYNYWWGPGTGGAWNLGIPSLGTTAVDFGPRSGVTDTNCYAGFVLT